MHDGEAEAGLRVLMWCDGMSDMMWWAELPLKRPTHGMVWCCVGGNSQVTRRIRDSRLPSLEPTTVGISTWLSPKHDCADQLLRLGYLSFNRGSATQAS